MINQIKQFITLQHPVEQKISQYFGENKVDFYSQLGMKGHNGLDYACITGTTVVAPCRMEIVDFYYENKDAGYGTTVFARSEPFQINDITYRVEMVFGHLDKFYNIGLGQWLNRGDLFAFSDNTGKYTTGSHLHFGFRLIRKGFLGLSWNVVDSNNGYLGYFDPLPLIDIKLNLEKYNGKIVKSSNSPRHYLVNNGILEWYEDEIAFACDGRLFSEAITIEHNLINQANVKTFTIDYNNHKTFEIKQLLGLLKNDPVRSTKLFNKYF